MTAAAPSPALPNERRLLILDDDPMVGMLVETVARLAGIATRLTERPADFFDALESFQPTHIVLDLTMPELSGEQVLDELARRGCRARIIVSSGVDPEQLQAALAQAAAAALDVAGSLPKPFAAVALRRLLA